MIIMDSDVVHNVLFYCNLCGGVGVYSSGNLTVHFSKFVRYKPTHNMASGMYMYRLFTIKQN